MIATPTVALLLDIRTAVTILIIPNLVMDVTQVFRGGFSHALWRRFAWLLVLTMIGVFLGTKVLVMLPLWVLNFFLGVMVLLFVLSNWLRFEFTISPRAEKNPLAAGGSDRRFAQRDDERCRPISGHLSVQPKAAEERFHKSPCDDFRYHKGKPIGGDLDLESFELGNASLSRSK